MTNPRLEELRAKFQENPRRYFAPYANELRKAGDAAQAIAVCRTHLATQPGHVSGHIVLGQALYEAAEANEAREVFTAALELDPENLIALRSLGEIAQVNGEFTEARQWYQRLLDADPRNTEVAQLLRDIPTETPATPLAVAPVEPVEEPTPFTIREEVAAAEVPAEPTPAPRFHTSFSGSGPAYKTAEDLAAESVAKSEEIAVPSSTDAFVDLQPTAHDQPSMAVPVDVPATTESEPLDMVDLGEETESFAAEAVQEAMPDESFDFNEPIVPAASTDANVESEPEFVAGMSFEEEPSHVSEPGVEPDSGFETVETYTTQSATDAIQPLDIEDFAADAFSAASNQQSPPEETAEPPRATFAERGFDGSVDDMGWMTTPSAAFSDLEAAPEDWFDDSASDAMSEATAPEPATASDHGSDSWFDEVPGAAAIESTEVTSDEFWLPPELPQVTNVEASAESADEGSSPIENAPEPEPWSTSRHEDVASETVSTPNAEESRWAPQAEAMDPVDNVAEQVAFASPVSDEPVNVPDEAAQFYTAEFHQQSEYQANEYADSAAAGDAHVEPAAASWSHDDIGAEASPEHEQQYVMPVPPDLAYEPEPAAEMSLAPDAVGHTPSESISTPAPVPFLTETLAELYLQQGFRDEALSIYRQLVERNPGDAGLKSRMDAIEQRDVVAPKPVPADNRAAAQSVRTFFSRLARRPAVTPTASTGSSGTGDQGVEPEVPFSVAASALANLFPASKPPESDEGAASTLAGAFTDPAGRPSRAAERELSLDHLFRDVPAGGTASGGVTLDEFYSNPNAGSGSSTEPGSEAEPDEASGTDIRQFTAWLEGLRKK